MKLKKSELRKKLGIKKGGRLQINSHGCGNYSVLVFRKNKNYSEYNFKLSDLPGYGAERREI